MNEHYGIMPWYYKNDSTIIAMHSYPSLGSKVFHSYENKADLQSVSTTYVVAIFIIKPKKQKT